MGGATWGLIASLAQWNALNRRIQRLPLWFILSGLIGVVVFAVGWAWLPSIYFGYMSNSGAAFLGNWLSVITWPLAGLLAGAATGGLINKLLQPPAPGETTA